MLRISSNSNHQKTHKKTKASTSHLRETKRSWLKSLNSGEFSWTIPPKLSEISKIYQEELSSAIKAKTERAHFQNVVSIFSVEPKNLFNLPWPPRDRQKVREKADEYCSLLGRTLKIPFVNLNPKLLEPLRFALKFYEEVSEYLENPAKSKWVLRGLQGKTCYPFFAQDHLDVKGFMRNVSVRLYGYFTERLRMNQDERRSLGQKTFNVLNRLISEFFDGAITPEEVRTVYLSRHK